MNIAFNCAGLVFDANINYMPGCPARMGGRPEDCYPEEDAELEFESLSCEGQDAMFLLESKLYDELNEAAYEAALGSVADFKSIAAIARWECRHG